MKDQIADVLADLQEMNHLDQLDAVVFVGLTEDGDTVYGHTDLSEEDVDRAHAAVYELVKDLQPQLDS